MTSRAAALLCCLLLAACAQQQNASGTSTSTGPPNDQIAVAGSTALQPLVTQAAQEYQNAHPDQKITVSGGGSGKGISELQAKTINVAASDVDPPAGSSFTDYKVAVVGFGIITGPNAGVTNLTRKQIGDIFTGKVTNWKQVGGSNQAIHVVNRPKGSGTRTVFEKTMLGGQPSVEGTVQKESKDVVKTLKNTPGSVSYVAFSYAKQFSFTPVSIDGVAANDANVKIKKYPFWSYEHLFTGAAPGQNVKDFISYVAADDAALDKLGFIAMRDMKQ